MAFLDNSGDIILDTVLTEIGRKRMATGNFTITKFAFGDDEIDYNLYNKNHESGSAYYDLEILQTPIFQASTGMTAHINYGLVSYRNTNLLYMPVMKRNNKLPESCAERNNIYYLAVNDGGVTSTALISAFGGVSGGGTRQLLQAGNRTGVSIIMETGLDTEELRATRANRDAYLVTNGLLDTSFHISVDTRFINTVLGPAPGDRFNNSALGGEADILTTLVPSIPIGIDPGLLNHQVAQIRAVDNRITYRVDLTTSDTSLSAIAGPRSAATFISFDTVTLAVSDYARYGKTGQSIAGASGTYRYIDTTVVVRASGGTQDQIPVRIIQKE